MATATWGRTEKIAERAPGELEGGAVGQSLGGGRAGGGRQYSELAESLAGPDRRQRGSAPCVEYTDTLSRGVVELRQHPLSVFAGVRLAATEHSLNVLNLQPPQPPPRC
jgi:hypothetical protein